MSRPLGPPPVGAPGAGPSPRVGGDLTGELIDTSVWTDEMVARAGIPIIDTKFVSVGGGIGSFVTVDILRIYGVPTADHHGADPARDAVASYEYLTRVSQIPRRERLRSDSSSTPDNIWGFPSYAVREAFGAKSVKDFVAPLWNVLTEPIFADYYTPQGRAGVRDDGARGQTASATTQCVRQRPGADGAAPAGRRLLHDPDAAGRAPPRPGGWPTAAPTCTSRSAIRG